MPFSKLFHKRGSLKNKSDATNSPSAKVIPKSELTLTSSGTEECISETEVKTLPKERIVTETGAKSLEEENKVSESEVKILPEENKVNKTEVRILPEENNVNKTEVRTLSVESEPSCVEEQAISEVVLRLEETPVAGSQSSVNCVNQSAISKSGINSDENQEETTTEQPAETVIITHRQRSSSDSKKDSTLKVKHTARKKSSSESETYQYQTSSEESLKERIIQLKERDLEEVIERYVNKLIQDSIVTAVKSVNMDNVCGEIWKNFSDRTYSESSDSIQNFVIEQRLASDSISEYIEELEGAESTESGKNQEAENDINQKRLISENEEVAAKECEIIEWEEEMKEIKDVIHGGYVADFEESLSIHSTASETSYEKLDLQNTQDANKIADAHSTEVDASMSSNDQLIAADSPKISKDKLLVTHAIEASNDQITSAEVTTTSNEKVTEVEVSEISNDQLPAVDVTDVSSDELKIVDDSKIHEQSPINDSDKNSNDQLMVVDVTNASNSTAVNDSNAPNNKLTMTNATGVSNETEGKSELSSLCEKSIKQDLTERTEPECLNEEDSSLNESVKINSTSQEVDGDSTDLIVMSPTEECPLLIPVGTMDTETSEPAEDLGDNLPQQQHPVEEEKKINWKVGYLHVKLPHKSRGKGHLKVWKKRCVAIQPDEFVNDPNNPCLMISVYNAESGTSRKHSAVFWKAVSCKKAVVYRSNSSTHRYAFTISDDEKAVIHLAADSESASQEWMAAIRSILWPPSPFMQLEKMLNGQEFEISMIDNEFSYHAGLLGMYGYLTITPTKLILVHSQQGYVIQEWYLNTVDKFQLVQQSKIEDVHKVLAMTTCSDSSTGKGEILMFCSEALALLQSLAATIHQVLTYHSKQEGGKYKKELEEMADWLVAPQPSKKEAPSEDYYKVPPRQVKSLLDIPNFIFQKSLTPVASAVCTTAAVEQELLQPTLETAKTNPTTASRDSGISAGNPVDEFLNCSVTSFVVGGGPFPGKSSDSELSEDTYTPPLSPEMKKKVFQEKKTEKPPSQKLES